MMKNKWFFGFILLFSGCSVLVNAADIPSVVEGQEGYSQEKCVANATNDCIQSVCETSTDIDCESECQILAMDKCKAMNE